MVRHSFALAFLGLLLAAAPAAAVSHVVLADHYLAQQADAILLGLVLGSSVSDDVGMITTNYQIDIEEVFKGFVGALPIMIRVQGGYLREEDRETVIFGTPTFARGERVLLFLSWDQRWGYRILHISQGAFYERFFDGERYLVRPLDQTSEVVLGEIQEQAGGERMAMVRNADDFHSWLRGADFSSDRSDGYLEFLSPDAEERLFKPFTLLKASKVVRRWTTNMTWKVDKKGIPGVFKVKKARKEFRKLIGLWNQQTGKTFKQKAKGKSGAKNNFKGVDGMNVLQGSDPRNVIGQDFVCGVGGVVGLGGVESTRASAVRWKNRETRRILEAGIIMNDNLGCAGLRAVLLALLHEDGHAQGIGHHCGDKPTPRCSASPAWLVSVMNASVPPGLNVPKLAEEDRNAALFLYDPDPKTPVPCAKKPPGAKGFCKSNVCGNCGWGQGQCKSNNQCLPGLECEQDPARAAELGVGAKRKFCVADEACNSFPPAPGERRTYEVVGTNIRFSTVTESVAERVGRPPQEVYLIRDPEGPRLGEYVGCSGTRGEVTVATDSYDPSDPSDNERLFWKPPLYYCGHGEPIGTTCVWEGLFADRYSREESEVLGYVSVTVPSGSFDNVMKLRIQEFDEFGLFSSTTFWIDRDIGVVKGEEDGDTIVLISYTSASAMSETSRARGNRSLEVGTGQLRSYLRLSRRASRSSVGLQRKDRPKPEREPPL
jgi:hypothetical protein